MLAESVPESAQKEGLCWSWHETFRSGVLAESVPESMRAGKEGYVIIKVPLCVGTIRYRENASKVG